MLQSLLQPSNQRLAVRHERRRADKRAGRRPSQLPLQIGRTTETEATPSPDHHFRNDLYICGKVSVAALHAIVGSLLLGIVVLVVGLVQLSPGAEAAQHRYYLMGAGAALVGIGVLGAVLRCLCLHWYNRRYLEDDDEAEDPTTAQNTQKNCVSVVDGGHHDKHDHKHEHKTEHKNEHKTEHKPELKSKLKTQHSVARDADLVKQTSAASET